MRMSVVRPLYLGLDIPRKPIKLPERFFIQIEKMSIQKATEQHGIPNKLYIRIRDVIEFLCENELVPFILFQIVEAVDLTFPDKQQRIGTHIYRLEIHRMGWMAVFKEKNVVKICPMGSLQMWFVCLQQSRWQYNQLHFKVFAFFKMEIGF